MSSYPPIKNGTKVLGKGDYTEAAIQGRAKHDGKTGAVCEYHDSHGPCYGVKFDDGEVAFYDPEELRPWQENERV